MAYCEVPVATTNARTPQLRPASIRSDGPQRRLNGHVQSFENMSSKDHQRNAASKASATSNASTREERRLASRPANGYHEDTERAAETIQTRFIDSRTYPIIFLLFHTTLTQANLDKEVIRRFEIEELLRKLESRDRRFVQETCDRFIEYVRNSEEVSVDSQVRGLESARWNVTDNNVNVEFKKVVNETFDESVNWGSVISFLGFALGFSVFIHNRGMKKTVVSVAEWTKEVIEEDIGTFFLRNNGWEGFREVIDTLLKRQRRLQSQHRVQSDDSASAQGAPSFWQNALAMTTVAAGAAVLLGLRQAFS